MQIWKQKGFYFDILTSPFNSQFDHFSLYLAFNGRNQQTSAGCNNPVIRAGIKVYKQLAAFKAFVKHDTV